MYRLLKTLTTLAFLMASVALFGQQAAALEAEAKRTSDRREAMKLYYQAAEKYLSNNSEKASVNAHQAYLIAEELRDFVMGARAAYLNAEGYARQGKFGQAKQRYTWGKESAINAKDWDFAAKSFDKMAQMARNEGETAQAQKYTQQAAELRRRPAETAGTAGASNPSSSAANRPAPTNQAELNAIREQFRREREAFENERRRMQTDVAALQRERERLNQGLTAAQIKERQLAEQSQQAQQSLAQKNQQLVTLSSEKANSDRTAARRQELYEILRDDKRADSLVYAQDLQEQEFQLQKSRNFRNVLLLILLSALVIVGLIYRRFLENQKQKKILEDKNRAIEEERQRSDELLLNILPAAIATELKTDGKAKAHRYDQASVMFIDFKSFTKISEQLSPEDLVNELDLHFKAFDFIIGQYKLEKIKTIGDAYMVASGLSDRVSTPLSIVRAALEIQEFLEDMKQEKQQQNKPYFEARIGIHVGPVVAGVVGVKKFAYDIWGDTVNIAARMQEACEPNRINVSEAIYNEVRYSFRCQPRGKMPAKNKADIEMYYVDGVLK